MNEPKQSHKKTLYQYIGVEPIATENEISQACKNRIAHCEALLAKGEPQAANMLMILKDAQRVLLDIEKKREYDQKLKEREFHLKESETQFASKDETSLQVHGKHTKIPLESLFLIENKKDKYQSKIIQCFNIFIVKLKNKLFNANDKKVALLKYCSSIIFAILITALSVYYL